MAGYLSELLMPIVATYLSLATALVGPVEVKPNPQRIYGNVPNYDADTMKLIYGESDVQLYLTVRVLLIDGPEMKSSCPYERALADKAKAATSEFLSRGPIYLTSVEGKLDVYGRLLVDVGVKGPDGKIDSLSQYLLTKHTDKVRPYGSGRKPWCDANNQPLP